jgi:hypothetical protein
MSEYIFCICMQDLTGCISFSNHPLVVNEETAEMLSVLYWYKIELQVVSA